MIHEDLIDIVNALDQSFWQQLRTATVIANHGDGTHTIRPDDTEIPVLQNVVQFGPCVLYLTTGDRVVYSFDQRRQPLITGRLVSVIGAQSIPLGEALLAAINTMITMYNTHTHPVSGASTSTPLPAFIATSIPSGVLSTTAKVQP